MAVTTTSSTPSGNCSLPEPHPDLPPELRAIGDFDQTYDASNAAQLADVSTRVVTALHPNLVGLQATSPVREASQVTNGYPAMVVPLQRRDGNAGTVAALVAFRIDCDGRALYWQQSAVTGPPQQNFPSVTQTKARSLLNGTVTLVYLSSPFNPRWRAGDGTTIAAQA